MSKTQVELVGDREVRVTRTFEAPRALVFRAFTEPAYVRQWLLGPDGWSMPVCEIDLRPEGAYRFEWSKKPDGERLKLAGTFHEVDAPARLTATERFQHDWCPNATEVVTEFAEQATARGTGTLHTQTMKFASPAEREAAMKTGMTDGMARSYDRLEEVLAKGEAA